MSSIIVRQASLAVSRRWRWERQRQRSRMCCRARESLPASRRLARAALRGARVLDQHRAAPGGASAPRCRRRRRRSSSCARDRGRARPRRRAASRARACGNRSPRSSGSSAVGMVEAVAPAVDLDAGLGEQIDDPRVDGRSSLGLATLPLAAAGWLETTTSTRPAPASRPTPSAAPGARFDVGAVERRLGQSRSAGRATRLVDDAVAIEEDRRAAPSALLGCLAIDFPLARPGRQAGVRDEQVPDDGLERLDVRRQPLGRGAGRRSRRRRAVAVGAVGLADDPEDRGARPRCASSSALTMFIETLCSREPPPTEKTSTASRARAATSAATPRRSSPSPRRWCARSARRRCRSARRPRGRRSCGSR